MKYQAISIDFYRNMKEIEQDKKDLKLLLKGLKYGYFFAIFIIILSAFFNGNLVMAQSQNIEFEFENGYAYNGVLPESTELENQRYTYEQTGHFPATYSFENDTIEDNPSGWILDESGGSINVIESFDGHTNVMEMDDTSGAGRIDATQSFSIQSNAIFEFWWAINDIDDTWNLVLSIYEGANPIIAIAINDNDLESYDIAWQDIKVDFIEVNTFFHIKIALNDSENSFDCYINEVLEANDFDYQNPNTNGITSIEFKTSTDDILISYIDAVGYSWNVSYDDYDLESLTFESGTQSGVLSNANIDDGNFFTIDSEFVPPHSIVVRFNFNISYPIDSCYLSYSMESDPPTPTVDLYDNNGLIDSGFIIDDDLVLLTNITYLEIDIEDTSAFDVKVYYLRLFIINYGYRIGDNLINPYAITNNTETDKFEFTFDSTGIINVNGDDDVNGFTDIENDFWNDDYVNVYDSIDDDVDKCIRVYGGQLGSVGIQRDFDVGVDTMEISWQFDLINFGYPDNQIYTKIVNSDSDTIAFFRLNGKYIPYGARNYANFSYFYNSEWVLLQTGIEVSNNYNMTFSLNWTDGNDFGLLNFDNNNYNITFENDQNTFGYLQIYGINDNNMVWMNLDLQIDWIRIIVNGSSLSDELMPDNMYILNGNDFSLLYQSFIEITFDIAHDNNVSIFLNDDIEIIPYIYNATAERVFFRNFYQAKSYSGLFLKIYNSTSYNIESIKIYGIQMINQQDSNDNSFLEFDYSYVNPNESYFYVSENDLHYYFESDDNGNLEYIQATFNIVDLSCEGYSIAFSHQKGTTYLQSECKVVFTTDTYLSYISMDTLQSVSVILPQEKVIKEIIFLVTDDDDTIIDTSEGYFSDFIFMYYSDIGITITTLSLLDMIPIVVLVVIIPMALYVGFGKRKELLVPSIMAMTIFGTVITIIPLWLTSVILFACISYYLIRKFGS